MEAQESCGRRWQFRIFLGFFLAVMVKTSPFLHGLHPRTFHHHLPHCKDHVAENYFSLEWWPIRTIYNLQNISLAHYRLFSMSSYVLALEDEEQRRRIR
ncbi:hypothetical protein OIU84_000933 [Salix udensis]|uniref:Uncharacterized protein n=1 Tax=Salix udensis TaxID=889485 RepID=A0AAD6PNP8_9ROSI|nr:hypothetical protein OIU84_000933 [Salix udensis]